MNVILKIHMLSEVNLYFLHQHLNDTLFNLKLLCNSVVYVLSMLLIDYTRLGTL